MSGPDRRTHRIRSGLLSACLAAAAALAGVGPALAASPSPAASLPAATPGPVSGASGASGPAAGSPRPPVLAYYYMWFNRASWNHAKTDVPALGPYDSTNPGIIEQQVSWARESGVDAFIASWKHTPQLDLALSELVSACHREGLKLVLIYEGLDVNRNPIPVSTVEADLTWFRDTYGSDPAFQLFGNVPAVVWSGSWKFGSSDIAAVRSKIGAPGSMLLLGSEKDAASYSARASLFDGDAYYWSSADPEHTPGYKARLAALAAAVHADHGLWLAPAAVGFDARLNGGTTVVDRRDGDTLRAAWAIAAGTSPDAIALISWNEYTENSYVEPSAKYGLHYLQVLAGLTRAAGPAPLPGSSASPSPAAGAGGPTSVGPSAAPAGPISGRPGGRPPATDSLINTLGSLAAAVFGIVLLVLIGRNLRRRPSRQGDLTDAEPLDD